MPVPPKPAEFDAELAPVGVEVKFFSQWQSRPFLDKPARLALVHTNAASREGNVESASNWSERNVSDPDTDYTIPHYQVDRDGRARKMLPSNRRGICNSTVLPGSRQWQFLTAEQQATVMSYPGEPLNVSRFSLGIETADTGTIADPTISAFTGVQLERIAEIVAYESLVPGNEIPLSVPAEWFGSGVGAHTDPFPFPCWTTVRGKPCPGLKKKAQMPALLARAIEIRDAWQTPPAPAPIPPTLEDDMQFLARSQETGKVYVGDGVTSVELSTEAMQNRVKAEIDAGRSRWRQPHQAGWPLITAWEQIEAPIKFDLPLFALVGKPR